MNDSHAVVLARRGLVSFLYDQLENYGTHPEESVFEPVWSSSSTYQRWTDDLLIKLFSEVGIGQWITKPPEIDVSNVFLNSFINIDNL